jgi:ribose 5-phosphate isomerase A
MITHKSVQHAKRAAGVAAANLIEQGMVVGIGTGSTAAYFTDALIQRCRTGLSVSAVATSKSTAERARQGGIKVIDIDAVSTIDLAVDGADEIDPQKRMVKGGGGALLREKIVASNAKEMIVVVDETKLVDRLGNFGLPVEIIPFGHTHTLRQIHEHGYACTLRMRHKSDPYITDNGNYICDLEFEEPMQDPDELAQELSRIPGVVETGLFLGLAGRIMVGYTDGHVEVEN